MYLIPTFLTYIWFKVAQRESFDGLDSWFILWVNVLLTLCICTPQIGFIVVLICLSLPAPRAILISTLTAYITPIFRSPTLLVCSSVPYLFPVIHGHLGLNREIVLLNYPANFVEYMAILHMLPASILANPPLSNLVSTFIGKEHIITCVPHCFESVRCAVDKTIRANRRVIVYPERGFTRRPNPWTIVGEYRTGIFKIAKMLQIPLRPICVTHFIHTMGYIHKFPVITIGNQLSPNIPFETLSTQLTAFWTKNLVAP